MPQGGVIEKGVCDFRGGPALPAAVPGRLAGQLRIALAAGRPTGAGGAPTTGDGYPRRMVRGRQRPDDHRSLCRPARGPARHHPADPLLRLFTQNPVAAQRAAWQLVCRRVALAADWSLFRRPPDSLLPAVGQRRAVDSAYLWRPRPGPRERSSLSGKRADPPSAADRRRL